MKEWAKVLLLTAGLLALAFILLNLGGCTPTEKEMNQMVERSGRMCQQWCGDYKVKSFSPFAFANRNECACSLEKK